MAALAEICDSSDVDLDGKEHFGFADGISQPTIDGLSVARGHARRTRFEPGEFILGYANEYGHYTDRPLLDPAADPRHILPMDVQGSGKPTSVATARTWCFASSSQDVRGFWHFLDAATRAPTAPAIRIAARGWPPRWSGAGRAARP